MSTIRSHAYAGSHSGDMDIKSPFHSSTICSFHSLFCNCLQYNIATSSSTLPVLTLYHISKYLPASTVAFIMAAVFTDNKPQRQCDLDINLDQTQSNCTSETIKYTKQDFKENFAQVITIFISMSAIHLFREGFTLDFWTVHSSPSTAWAVTPLLAYPFLPSGGLFSIPCEVFLIWPNALGITHQFCTIVLDRIYEQPPSHPWQFWQPPLMWFTLLAGTDRLFSKKRGEPDEEDFRTSSDNVQWWFSVPFFTCVIIPCFKNLADEASWLWYVVRLLVLVVYVWAYIVVALILRKGVIRPAVYYFTSRRVPRWRWLPENGAEGDFEPVGSKILAGWVLVMPLVLTVLMGIRPSV